jgi:hypothetical protein
MNYQGTMEGWHGDEKECYGEYGSYNDHDNYYDGEDDFDDVEKSS